MFYMPKQIYRVVVVHRLPGNFELRAGLVSAQATVGVEISLDAQAEYVWGWVRYGAGFMPALAVRRDVLEGHFGNGITVQELVHVATATNIRGYGVYANWEGRREITSFSAPLPGRSSRSQRSREAAVTV